jgi:hypothetical protein
MSEQELLLEKLQRMIEEASMQLDSIQSMVEEIMNQEPPVPDPVDSNVPVGMPMMDFEVIEERQLYQENIPIWAMMSDEHSITPVKRTIALAEGDVLNIFGLCQFVQSNGYNVGVGRYLEIVDNETGEVKRLVDAHGDNILNNAAHYTVGEMSAFFKCEKAGDYTVQYRAYAGSTAAKSGQYLQARYPQLNILVMRRHHG